MRRTYSGGVVVGDVVFETVKMEGTTVLPSKNCDVMARKDAVTTLQLKRTTANGSRNYNDLCS
jgi:hypothetical protein